MKYRGGIRYGIAKATIVPIEPPGGMNEMKGSHGSYST